MNDKDIITADEVMLACMNKINRFTNLIIPNVKDSFFGIREADLLIVSPAGFCWEIEIKVTFSDYKAEFKKKYAVSYFMGDFRLKKKIFAIPAHIFKAHEEQILELLPDYAGLWLARWHTTHYSDGPYSFLTICYPNPREPKIKRKNECRKLTESEIENLKRIYALKYYSLLNRKVNSERGGER